jgi:hypothetical protein
MLECSVCRRLYDGRFKVFVPPYHEAFDTIECARRAAEAWGLNKIAPVPVILPTIEAVVPRRTAQVTPAVPRRGVAALAAAILAPGQVALASGVGLLAGGTAASIYLTARPAGNATHTTSVASALPHRSVGLPPAAAEPSTTGLPGPPTKRAITRPRSGAAGRGSTEVPAAGPTRHTVFGPVPAAATRTATSPGEPAVTSQLASRTLPTVQPSPGAEPTTGSTPGKPKPPTSRKPRPVTPKPRTPPQPAPEPAAPSQPTPVTPSAPVPASGEGGAAGPGTVPASASASVPTEAVRRPASHSESEPPVVPPPSTQPGPQPPPPEPGPVSGGGGQGDDDQGDDDEDRNGQRGDGRDDDERRDGDGRRERRRHRDRDRHGDRR